jgi:hypothetical protein
MRMRMSELITVEELKNAIPSRKNTINEEVVELINMVKDEPEFQGVPLINTLVTYEGLMTKHKASIREFVDAVKFCAYLVSMEDNYTEAYKKTFCYRALNTSGTKESRTVW